MKLCPLWGGNHIGRDGDRGPYVRCLGGKEHVRAQVNKQIGNIAAGSGTNDFSRLAN